MRYTFNPEIFPKRITELYKKGDKLVLERTGINSIIPLEVVFLNEELLWWRMRGRINKRYARIVRNMKTKIVIEEA